MNFIFRFLAWLLVTFIEGVVFFFFWTWFIEKTFLFAPVLSIPQAMGLKLAVSIFFPDQLLRDMPREVGKGNPVMDLALLRIYLAGIIAFIGWLLHMAIPTIPTLL